MKCNVFATFALVSAKHGTKIRTKLNDSLWCCDKGYRTVTVTCLVPGGFMEELDNRWILVDSKSHCPEGNSAPATLGLTNMAGKFVCLHSALDLSVQFLWTALTEQLFHQLP